tara:strand:+ start:636 stop:911 length:276 start_codon:yes stop_codon:yes gene_type:complete
MFVQPAALVVRKKFASQEFQISVRLLRGVEVSSAQRTVESSGKRLDLAPSSPFSLILLAKIQPPESDYEIFFEVGARDDYALVWVEQQYRS